MLVEKINDMNTIKKVSRIWKIAILYGVLAVCCSWLIWFMWPLDEKEEKPKLDKLKWNINPCQEIKLKHEKFAYLWHDFAIIFFLLKYDSVYEITQMGITLQEKQKILESLKQGIFDFVAVSQKEKNNQRSLEKFKRYRRKIMDIWEYIQNSDDEGIKKIKQEIEALQEISSWLLINDDRPEKTDKYPWEPEESPWDPTDISCDYFFKSSALKDYALLRKILTNANQESRDVRELSVWLLYCSFSYWTALKEGLFLPDPQIDDVLFQRWENLPAQTVNDFRYFSMLDGKARLPSTVKHLSKAEQKVHYIKLREDFLKKVLGSDYQKEAAPSPNIKERMEEGEYIL